MKRGLFTIAVLLSVSILPAAVFDREQLVAKSKRTTATRRQQQIVKRINQRAQRFYRKFVDECVHNEVALESEVNELVEDLLLAVDGLSDPRYRRHNLIIVMQIASDIESLLPLEHVSSEVVMTWAYLHADLDLLAKIHKLRWRDAVITLPLIAALENEPVRIKDTEFTVPKYIICPIYGRFGFA